MPRIKVLQLPQRSCPRTRIDPNLRLLHVAFFTLVQPLHRLQHLDGQIRRLPIVRCDFVHDRNGIFVAASAHEVLGGFVEVEDEETDDEADEHESAHGVHKVAPALVFGTRAGGGCGAAAGEVGDERPCDLDERCVRNVPV